MSYLCGPRQPTQGDLDTIAEFGAWLADQPRRAPALRPVRRPQHCDCGANQLITVAHLDTCTSRRAAP